jgi:hypothetical protein
MQNEQYKLLSFFKFFLLKQAISDPVLDIFGPGRNF